MIPKVAVVIVNYNRVQDTIECLNSLKECAYTNLKIILVDNGSTDDSENIIRKVHADITIIQAGRNLGFCAGNNLGIQYALSLPDCPTFILLLNNDTLVESAFLSPLVEAMEQDFQAGAAGGTICYYPEKEKIWYAGGKFNFWRASSFSDHEGEEYSKIIEFGEQQTTFITGCMILIRSEVLSKVGLLDEKYFMYFEDAEYSLRLIKHGFHLLYVPQSRIYHKIENRATQPLSLYFSVRNRLLFINKVTDGSSRVIAKIYFYVVTIIKMMNWGIRKPELYNAARYALVDYHKGIFYEGRGLSLNQERHLNDRQYRS
jgi:GT2 family glycosyltransferase